MDDHASLARSSTARILTASGGGAAQTRARGLPSGHGVHTQQHEETSEVQQGRDDGTAPLRARPAIPRRIIVGLLATLGLILPAFAGPEQKPQDKTEAARVAKKMAKAAGKACQAEEERDALRHFEKAVAEYAELHAKQLAKLASREEPAAAQKALARAIEVKRPKAEQGDVFRPEIQPLFRRLIAEQLQGPDTRAAQKAVLEGNPSDEADSAPVVVRVNGLYPIGATVSTVPPSVLVTLPPLPSCLHYRFVDRDLILVDSAAQLIVDFLPAAAPAPATEPLP